MTPTTDDWRDVLSRCRDSPGLVQASARQCRLDGADGTSLTLTGWHPTDAAVRMRGAPGSAGVGHLPGLAGRRGLEQTADYVVFVERDGVHFGIIVELKKTLRLQDSKAFDQVRRTRPIAAYLARLAQDEGITDRPVTLRHVVVAAEPSRRLPKPPVRATRRGLRCRWDHAGISGAQFVATRLSLREIARAATDHPSLDR